MVKRLAFNGLAILALAASGSASAAEKTGFYAGVGLGQASLELDSGVNFDNDDTGFKLFGGYAFNKFIAVEAAYLDGGAPDQALGGGQRLEIELTGINVSAVGTLPITEAFSAFGRLGFTSFDVDASNGNATASGGDEEFAYGIGALYNINDAFTLRAEYEAIDISEIVDNSNVGADSTFLSLSGIYRF